MRRGGREMTRKEALGCIALSFLILIIVAIFS